ncbi:hypothetical protein, partial [Desulfosporosinus sp. I2]|uniref:hypothetical protein n=1 Tax=Desulfosporosinus sp. I2 TaxID=1617025 RepID=UPI0005EF8FD4
IAEPPTTKEDLVAKNEPFATLRLVTHTPAVWILNFRVRYTKNTIVSGGHYRRATHPKGTLRGEGELFATLRLIRHSPAVWIPNGWNPGASSN